MPTTFVVGAGPGIGTAVARRFAREGHAVGLLARSAATVDAAVAAVRAEGVRAAGATADVTVETGLAAALDELVASLGPPDVVVHNAALIRRDTVGELTSAQLLATFAVNVGGAVTTAAHLLPAMAERGSGTFVVTGGMPRGAPAFTSLSLGKAAVRALVELLAEQHGPAGVHVATVTVAGPVAPDSAFDPDEIADAFWDLHREPVGSWTEELLYAGRDGVVPPARVVRASPVRR
ncbi:SDR family NAD(P)-dependent oxidoreductase [Iamia sp. SCSIO 61187]|uniref:SDR family NAD(P)-dependent oxidoreductase n=1 Tax=Iamia sp. SCSIO 61187 TaxID=2722752 RepID=UPI001C62F1AA|nr:SDR family NAD(P)-dependent oxidoreductase [Iamia sp. SCSIO 61187]QYG95098.1 SDR family NAD(P)-dependent oxidoreductase [Iamia sp. SCSIO 61187]